MNVAQNFTKKQVAEFLKCAGDPVYFAQKYVKIINLDEGLVPFKMYDFQEKLVIIFIIIDSIFVRCLDSQVSQRLWYLSFTLRHLQ